MANEIAQWLLLLWCLATTIGLAGGLYLLHEIVQEHKDDDKRHKF